MVREFRPRVGLCADSWEPGACFGLCVSLSAPPPLMHVHMRTLSLSKINIKKGRLGGSVDEASNFSTGHDLTVHGYEMSPASGSVLTAGSLEPASDSVSPSLSTPPLLALCLCLSLKNK